LARICSQENPKSLNHQAGVALKVQFITSFIPYICRPSCSLKKKVDDLNFKIKKRKRRPSFHVASKEKQKKKVTLFGAADDFFYEI
jgi:hypothetical protein